MTAFTTLILDLRKNISTNKVTLGESLKKNPNSAYRQLCEICAFVSARHSVTLEIHFPKRDRILDIDGYGTENVTVIIDKFRRQFPIPRDKIKQVAVEVLGPTTTSQDAYMYEGKQGVRIIMEQGRIEVLPGSIHFWCRLEDNVLRFGDWMIANVYSNQKG